MAEAYLAGDEFTVAVIGNGADARCLPLVRYRFDVLPEHALPIVGFEAKWLWDQPDADFEILECPAQVAENVAAGVRETALAAYHALNCRDWARVDVRLGSDGVPYAVEINPLPGVIPDPAAHSCFPRAAAEDGMTHAELIHLVVQTAWRRWTGAELDVRPLAEAVR